jgi:hypothetical protein
MTPADLGHGSRISKRTIATFLVAFVTCAASEVMAQSSPETTVSPTPLAPVLVTANAGVMAGWDVGGTFSVGVAAGGQVARAAVSVRLTAGATIEGLIPAVATGIDVGFRGFFRIRPGLTITCLVAASYLARVRPSVTSDEYFTFHIPNAHLALGLMAGRGRRFMNGAEIGMVLGCSFNSIEGEGFEPAELFIGGEATYIVTF